MVEAVIAAGDDDGVHLRGLDNGNTLVGGAVHDVIAPGGEAGALLRGVRCCFEIDREAALGKKPAGLGRVQRQRLRAGEHHDGEIDLMRNHAAVSVVEA